VLTWRRRGHEVTRLRWIMTSRVADRPTVIDDRGTRELWSAVVEGDRSLTPPAAGRIRCSSVVDALSLYRIVRRDSTQLNKTVLLCWVASGDVIKALVIRITSMKLIVWRRYSAQFGQKSVILSVAANINIINSASYGYVCAQPTTMFLED